MGDSGRDHLAPAVAALMPDCGAWRGYAPYRKAAVIALNIVRRADRRPKDVQRIALEAAD